MTLCTDHSQQSYQAFYSEEDSQSGYEDGLYWATNLAEIRELNLLVKLEAGSEYPHVGPTAEDVERVLRRKGDDLFATIFATPRYVAAWISAAIVVWHRINQGGEHNPYLRPGAALTDIGTLSMQLEKRYGDVPLSALGRVAAIEDAEQRLRASVFASIDHIAERIRPRPRIALSATEILRRATHKGDAEAKYIWDNVSDEILRGAPLYQPTAIAPKPTPVERFPVAFHEDDSAPGDYVAAQMAA
jgi:hypothetical protein